MPTISDLISSIRKKQENEALSTNNVYFRGQRSHDLLVPGLLRQPIDHAKENQLFCDCLIMSGNDVTSHKSSWESLALFQHYGIPTRLLDWSSSLVHALYFAASKCLHCSYRKECKKSKKACHGNPTLWILDPEKMHEHLYPKKELIAFTIGIDHIPDYSEFFVRKNRASRWPYKSGPIFVEIPWTNPRIKSQKGYFTFHAKDTPMDSLKTASSWLTKYEFNGKERGKLLDELETINIGENDIYTDLVSLARHLKHVYGFE
jgi:hypothetical protein